MESYWLVGPPSSWARMACKRPAEGKDRMAAGHASSASEQPASAWDKQVHQPPPAAAFAFLAQVVDGVALIAGKRAALDKAAAGSNGADWLVLQKQGWGLTCSRHEPAQLIQLVRNKGHLVETHVNQVLLRGFRWPPVEAR